MCVCVRTLACTQTRIHLYGENTNLTLGFIFNTNILANYVLNYLLQPLD